MAMEEYVLQGERQVNFQNRYLVLRKLGQGTYGKVQLAFNRETNKEVAMKTIKKNRIVKRGDLNRIRREIKLMSTIRHPNIIHIYEVFETKEKIVLVMQYASGGELYEYLNCHKTLPEDEVRRLFRQICAAIYYCHKNNICHRDLKLENILLDEAGYAKITDFGLSNIFDRDKKISTFCGSPLYASPEIVKGIPYNGPEVDCWSLGVLLFALLYGTMPFDGKCFKDLVSQISSGNYKEPENKSSGASRLIRKLLTTDVSERADIYTVCKDEWINQCYSTALPQLADSMSRSHVLEYNESNAIESSNLKADGKTDICESVKLCHFNTFKRISKSKEFKINTNRIPYNQKSKCVSNVIVKKSFVLGKCNASSEVLLVLNNIVNAVVETAQIPSCENQNKISIRKIESKTIEKLYQKNGFSPCLTNYIRVNPIHEPKTLTTTSNNDQVDDNMRLRQSRLNLNKSINQFYLMHNCKNENKSRTTCCSNCSQIVPNENTNRHHHDSENDNFSSISCKDFLENSKIKIIFPVVKTDCDPIKQHISTNSRENKRLQQIFESQKRANLKKNIKAECSINWCRRKSSDFLAFRTSRQRSNSLCKTLAFIFECGILGDSENKTRTCEKKLPGKIEIPLTFHSPELLNITEKEPPMIFPCVSVSENKEIIQKKIDRTKRAAINLIPHKHSDFTLRRRKMEFTEGICDFIPECSIMENFTDFSNISYENHLGNIQCSSDDCENDSIRNLSFCEEPFDHTKSIENEAQESDLFQKINIINIGDTKKDVAFDRRKRCGKCVSCYFPHQRQGVESAEVLIENLNDAGSSDGRASNIQQDNFLQDQTCKNNNSKLQVFSTHELFEKIKGRFYQSSTRNYLAAKQTNAHQQLLEKCDHLSEFSISNKLCSSCSFDDECSFLKFQNNFNDLHINNGHKNKCASKLMLNGPCCRCDRCTLLLRILQSKRYSSSSPNLSHMARTKRRKLRRFLNSKNLSRSSGDLHKVNNTESDKILNKTISINRPCDRNGRGILQSHSFIENQSFPSVVDSTNMGSLNSEKAFSDFDIRYNNKVQCSRKLSLDESCILTDDILHKYRFRESSIRKFSGKKRLITAQKISMTSGRNISSSIFRMINRAMKLNSLKKVHEAEIEINKGINREQPDNENSESLLEALKIHGYKNVISSRFQQHETEESDLQNGLYSTCVSSVPMYLRMHYTDYNNSISFPVNFNALSMLNNNNIYSRMLNGNVIQRKPERFYLNDPFSKPFPHVNVLIHVDDSPHVPLKYTKIGYPIFPLTDIKDEVSTNSTRNDKTYFAKSPQRLNDMQWKNEDPAAISNSTPSLSKSNYSICNMSKMNFLQIPKHHQYFTSTERNAEPKNDLIKEESVSHRIWKKSFYSRFNHASSSKRPSQSDNRLLKVPEPDDCVPPS